MRPIEIKFPKLYEAVFLTRKNRFLLSCQLKHTGEMVDVHLPDSGRLPTLLVKGRRCWLRHVEGKNRKTKWSAVLIESDAHAEHFVSLNSMIPNQLVEKTLENRLIEPFHDWESLQRECKSGGSRWDFCLNHKGESTSLVEVKGVTHVEGQTGYFPDSPTARGTRHVRELTEIACEPGWQGGVIFVAQRSDITILKPSKQIDPRFAQALYQAQEKGVHIRAFRCDVSIQSIKLRDEIPVVFDENDHS
ncbi:DNA/RNA nuclease SfsA [Texcoconibacillus texcoconensis]|uniref:Sugar fermentation stimulation protein homolog n=1 Tax=Texcoconibacillus texcoconensis TaxID=1095777 RepID=A0A840QPJ6_9BACI|nr:DNA/RNA nuclease SfsA [Texcoconibacillus texcoconensis]MBB5173332.1 sugar fermentation stimulation protein A [Texcoconibacillus texcoconensis]